MNKFVTHTVKQYLDVWQLKRTLCWQFCSCIRGFSEGTRAGFQWRCWESKPELSVCPFTKWDVCWFPYFYNWKQFCFRSSNFYPQSKSVIWNLKYCFVCLIIHSPQDFYSINSKFPCPLRAVFSSRMFPSSPRGPLGAEVICECSGAVGPGVWSSVACTEAHGHVFLFVYYPVPTVFVRVRHCVACCLTTGCIWRWSLGNISLLIQLQHSQELLLFYLMLSMFSIHSQL